MDAAPPGRLALVTGIKGCFCVAVAIEWLIVAVALVVGVAVALPDGNPVRISAW